ncbi:MAG TPA: hypothetical protein VM783_17995 [Candidatus Acidoferrum sp.]|nr:hypothetical protein [Candidatus Acidoferrum sp.]
MLIDNKGREVNPNHIPPRGKVGSPQQAKRDSFLAPLREVHVLRHPKHDPMFALGNRALARFLEEQRGA